MIECNDTPYCYQKLSNIIDLSLENLRRPIVCGYPTHKRRLVERIPITLCVGTQRTVMSWLEINEGEVEVEMGMGMGMWKWKWKWNLEMYDMEVKRMLGEKERKGRKERMGWREDSKRRSKLSSAGGRKPQTAHQWFDDDQWSMAVLQSLLRFNTLPFPFPSHCSPHLFLIKIPVYWVPIHARSTGYRITKLAKVQSVCWVPTYSWILWGAIDLLDPRNDTVRCVLLLWRKPNSIYFLFFPHPRIYTISDEWHLRKLITT